MKTKSSSDGRQRFLSLDHFPQEDKEGVTEQRFYVHDDLDEYNAKDLVDSVNDGRLIGIVDEDAGGIVAYALSEEMAATIIHALRFKHGVW